MPPEVVTGLPTLGRRPADSHKGMFGHVLVVAGSRGMSGAAILCGLGGRPRRRGPRHARRASR